MSRVLVISLSDLGADPRVERQLRVLGAGHEIVSAGFGPPRVPVSRHVALEAPGGPPLRSAVAQALRSARRFEQAYWSHPAMRRNRERLSGHGCTAILANDALALPLAFAVAGGAPVVFDAHEYAPAENAGHAWWRLLLAPAMRDLVRRHVPRVAAMTAVSAGVARRLEQDTGVRAAVVTNAAPFAALAPGPVDPARIRMVHWGVADPQRRIETMIETADLLGAPFHLDLLLVREGRYLERLRRRAARSPRVRVLPPVPMDDLARFGNAYDVGIYPLPALHLNQEFALPNKFFQFVQARLAVALGPSPEMARIARERGFGIHAPDFSAPAMAQAIAAAGVDGIAQRKAAADRAAAALSSEHEERTIAAVMERVLAPDRAGVG